MLRPRSRRGLFADRDFRLFWGGESISTLGSSITSVALPLVAVVELGAGPQAVGVLTAAVWLPWLLLGLPAGVWVDRLPRRAVLAGCNLASAALLVSVPVAAALDALTLPHLLAVALLTGSAAVFFSAAYQAYLPELFGRDELIEANAKLQGSAAAARVAGPGTGGLLAQAFGAVAGLLADAVTFLVATAALLAIRRRPAGAERPPPAGPLAAQVREGLAFIARDPYLRTLTLFGACANLVLTGYQSVQLLFLVREVGLSPGAVGVLASAGAFGGVLGALAVRPVCRRLGTARGVLVVLLGATPFGLLLPLAAPGWRLGFFVLGSVVVTGGVVCGNIVLGSFRQSYAPPRLLTRIVATSMFVNHATIPVGGLLGGFLGAAIGLRPTLWTMTALLVCTGAILLTGPLHRTRDLPTGHAPHVG
ncbi:MFS transporter [Kitasatospora sp. NPDC054939]